MTCLCYSSSLRFTSLLGCDSIPFIRKLVELAAMSAASIPRCSAYLERNHDRYDEVQRRGGDERRYRLDLDHRQVGVYERQVAVDNEHEVVGGEFNGQ